MTEERSFRVVLEMPEERRSIDCGASEYILNAAADHGINLPVICRQGRCLTCAARLLEGIVEHDHPDSYFAEDQTAGFILTCLAMPRRELRILTHQEWEMRAHRLAHNLPAPYA
ncbi:2Fe-2S iron-sulfur cluster-binding protein [Edaphobacter bradus]|uniref:2Fe-2S iron-sulfur cluster-binding protein n=1 Tax=Edaphobacter bradus TaxID=2259016 RepID=UPI0021DFA262|nr:2Fe-2S iron-sulfur cluster-binding protein [Edaphobacter bradus]